MVKHLFFSWFLSTFGQWANSSGVVYEPSKLMVNKNVFVGKLTCSGRLLDYQHFQMWCVKGTKVIYNQVNDLTEQTVVTSSYCDNKPNEVDACILWLLAVVEGNPQTFGYQIAYSVGGVEKPMLSGAF